MAEFKRQTFELSTGKKIKLYGNAFFISKSLEIGEGSVPGIFRVIEDFSTTKALSTVENPYRLTAEELQELCDYNIRLWLDLKDSIRKYGTDNPRVFNRDDLKLSGGRPEDSPERGKNKSGDPKEKENGKGDSSGKEKGNKTANASDDIGTK